MCTIPYHHHTLYQTVIRSAKTRTPTHSHSQNDPFKPDRAVGDLRYFLFIAPSVLAVTKESSYSKRHSRTILELRITEFDCRRKLPSGRYHPRSEAKDLKHERHLTLLLCHSTLLLTHKTSQPSQGAARFPKTTTPVRYTIQNQLLLHS
jgi:hypothetical protein